MRLAFVLLSEARLPKGEDVARGFATFAARGESVHVRSGEAVAATRSDEAASGEIIELDLDPPGNAFVALAPYAVPKGEAEAAVSHSLSAMGTGWELPGHTAHLIVMARDHSALPAIESLSRFTSLLAAVAAAAHTVGIYWGDARATHDPAFFRAVASDKDFSMRVALWSGLSIARDRSGRLSLSSLGMKQLGLPELLLVAPSSNGENALNAFMNLLSYAAERGKEPADGETIGLSADQRWAIRHVASPIDPSAWVWRVEMD